MPLNTLGVCSVMTTDTAVPAAATPSAEVEQVDPAAPWSVAESYLKAAQSDPLPAIVWSVAFVLFWVLLGLTIRLGVGLIG